MSPKFLPGGQFPAGLAVLLDAFDSAVDSDAGHWEFAVEFQLLRESGLTVTNLRWLIDRPHFTPYRPSLSATRC